MERTDSIPERKREVKPIILFDIDNTLADSFTIFAFADFLKKKRLIYLKTPEILDIDHQHYLDGLLAYEEFAKAVVDHYCEGLKGQKQEEVLNAGKEFLPLFLEKICPFTQNLVDIMKKQGQTLAVSGVPKEAGEPFINHVGISKGIFLEALTDGGVYTGLVKSNMALGNEKRKAVSELTKIGYDFSKSFAFGDSLSDSPILEAVTNPVAVNPNPSLAEKATQNSWLIVNSNNILEKIEEKISELAAK